MTTLADDESANMPDPVHLLLIGPTKAGKTHYIVQAILDGFTVFYVDNDNGINTVRRLLKGNKEAMARVHYVKTSNLWEFTSAFFARNKFQWNETRDEVFSLRTADPNDKITTIMRKLIPKGVIFVFDSWTSASILLLSRAAEKAGVTIDDFNDAGRDAFGNANRSANTMLMNLQAFPHHVILQAHPDFYERREAAPGVVKEATKEGNLIIKENIEIPYSVSRPHGFSMGKFFNEIAWLNVSAMGAFRIDFRQLKGRIGGGSPMKEGDPSAELRFSRCLAEVIHVSNDNGWIDTRPASFYIEEAARLAEEKAAAAAAAKSNQPAKGTEVAKPAATSAPRMSMLGK